MNGYGKRMNIDKTGLNEEVIEYWFKRMQLLPLKEEHGATAATTAAWKDEKMTFEDRLELARRLALMEGEFSHENMMRSDIFRRVTEAIRNIYYKELDRKEDVARMLFDNFKQMNYAAKVAILDISCFYDSPKAIPLMEELMNESRDYYIVTGCWANLKSLFKIYSPERLPELDFDLNERFDPETRYSID